MRRIVIAVMSTISGLVMLFSYHTSTSSVAVVAGGNDSSGSTTTEAPSSDGASATPTPSESGTASSGSGSSSAGTSGTFTGDAVDTRWGTVQVQITVKDGAITASKAVAFPQDNPRDQEINAYAVPQLNREVVQAQSASIDSVSGATVTSDGYLQSLQSAIDQANL